MWLLQEAEAAEAEAVEARAAASGPAPPPTTILGFVPCNGQPNPAPATGKLSWPVGFFKKQKQSHAASLQITATSSLQSQASRDSDSILQQLTVAADQPHSAGGTSAGAAQAESDSGGQENKLEERSAGECKKKDHGAVWRDAALAGQLPFHVQSSRSGCKLTAPPSRPHRCKKKWL